MPFEELLEVVKTKMDNLMGATVKKETNKQKPQQPYNYNQREKNSVLMGLILSQRK